MPVSCLRRSPAITLDSFVKIAFMLNRIVLPATRVASLTMMLLLAASLSAQIAYDEPWRPQYQFTPAKNFMNDPNGLVFYKGEYHLFYQFNPQGNRWGHMSWGHAVSRDLVHWQHLPVAIPEQPGYMIYSGSAVVDWKNSSGLCQSTDKKDPSCLVAIYTAATGDTWQRQHIAVSQDRGRTWTEYAGNPVADLKAKDFRDPHVFWYEPQKKWVMAAVLADERQLVLLESRDLKSWKRMSTFGPAGDSEGQWECPDLFELPVEGTREKKWVLVINRNPGAPAGGTGVRYIVGRFDGTTFVAETPDDTKLWADYGKDFYATQSYNDIPATDGRRIWMGWISNWQYANAETTEFWRGGQSFPRELRLGRFPDGVRLLQSPIREMKTLRRPLLSLKNVSLDTVAQEIRKAGINGDLLEIEAHIAPGAEGETGFRVRKGKDVETVVGFTAGSRQLFVDRTRSGEVAFSKDFPARHSVVLRENSHLKLHLFIDRSSVEVFANDGEATMTERIYPPADAKGLEVYSTGGRASVLSLQVWALESVWK